MQQGPIPQLLLTSEQAKQAYKAAKKGDLNIGFDEKNYQLFSGKGEDGSIQYYAIDERKIGSGVQGEVFLSQMIFESSRENDNIENLAILKRSQKKTERNTEKEFDNEFEILKILKRDRGYFRVEKNGTEEKECYLFSKFCSGVLLSDLIYNEDGSRKELLPPNFILKIARAILIAAEELRENGILHRDIKPDNVIIFNNNGEIIAHFIDFGTACRMQDSTKEFVGTEGHQAPELYKSKKTAYALHSEYYSIGLLFAELSSKNNYREYKKARLEAGEKTGSIPVYADEDILKAFSDLFKDEPPIFNCIRLLTAEDPCDRPSQLGIKEMIRVLNKTSPASTPPLVQIDQEREITNIGELIKAVEESFRSPFKQAFLQNNFSRSNRFKRLSEVKSRLLLSSSKEESPTTSEPLSLPRAVIFTPSSFPAPLPSLPVSDPAEEVEKQVEEQKAPEPVYTGNSIVSELRRRKSERFTSSAVISPREEKIADEKADEKAEEKVEEKVEELPVTERSYRSNSVVARLLNRGESKIEETPGATSHTNKPQ